MTVSATQARLAPSVTVTDSVVLGPAGAAALACGLIANGSLQQLWLDGHDVRNAGLAALAAALTPGHSSADHAPASAATAAAAAAAVAAAGAGTVGAGAVRPPRVRPALGAPRLRGLWLRRCGVTAHGALVLATALQRRKAAFAAGAKWARATLRRMRETQSATSYSDNGIASTVTGASGANGASIVTGSAPDAARELLQVRSALASASKTWARRSRTNTRNVAHVEPLSQSDNVSAATAAHSPPAGDDADSSESDSDADDASRRATAAFAAAAGRDGAEARGAAAEAEAALGALGVPQWVQQARRRRLWREAQEDAIAVEMSLGPSLDEIRAAAAAAGGNAAGAVAAVAAAGVSVSAGGLRAALAAAAARAVGARARLLVRVDRCETTAGSLWGNVDINANNSAGSSVAWPEPGRACESSDRELGSYGLLDCGHDSPHAAISNGGNAVPSNSSTMSDSVTTSDYANDSEHWEWSNTTGDCGRHGRNGGARALGDDNDGGLSVHGHLHDGGECPFAFITAVYDDWAGGHALYAPPPPRAATNGAKASATYNAPDADGDALTATAYELASFGVVSSTSSTSSNMGTGAVRWAWGGVDSWRPLPAVASGVLLARPPLHAVSDDHGVNLHSIDSSAAALTASSVSGAMTARGVNKVTLAGGNANLSVTGLSARAATGIGASSKAVSITSIVSSSSPQPSMAPLQSPLSSPSPPLSAHAGPEAESAAAATAVVLAGGWGELEWDFNCAFSDLSNSTNDTSLNMQCPTVTAPLSDTYYKHC